MNVTRHTFHRPASIIFHLISQTDTELHVLVVKSEFDFIERVGKQFPHKLTLFDSINILQALILYRQCLCNLLKSMKVRLDEEFEPFYAI